MDVTTSKKKEDSDEYEDVVENKTLNSMVPLWKRNKKDIKVIGIRHGEKMYETLLTNEECAHTIDMGNFYRVPCDKRGLNYDKYFIKGDTERNVLMEFNSNNTTLLTLEQVKEKLLSLQYIQNEIKGAKSK